MPTINTADKLIEALRNAASGRTFSKASAASEGAGAFHSLWKVAGTPGAGASPPAFGAGSGYVPTKATTGAHAFNNAAADGNNAAVFFSAFGGVANFIFCYDRLWACSGFSTVSTSAQNVTTPGNLPTGRDPNNGADVEPWIEIYTAPGATAATWTLTGTDALGNTGRTWTYAHPANAETVGQMAPFAPGGASPAAVNGIRQVTSLTCSISSGTAGDVGVTLLRRIATAAYISGSVDSRDALRLGMPPVFNDSCIALAVLCTSGNTGVVMGDLAIAESTT